jgi:hypothetical protein
VTTAKICVEPNSIRVDHRTAGAIYRLIDNIALMPFLRDGKLTPDEMRRVMDFWNACDKLRDAGIIL